MYTSYNMNQLTLNITSSYRPKEDSTAWFINELVESLEINEPYLFGRSRNDDLSVMLNWFFLLIRRVFLAVEKLNN